MPWARAWAALCVMFGVLAVADDAKAQGDCPGEILPPRVLITLDKSGSMDNNRKWPSALAAIDTLLGAIDGEAVHFGLQIFPEDSPGCDHPLSARSVRVACGPNTAGAIRRTLDGLSPNGGTPIEQALRRAQIELEGQDDLGQPFVVLITDGQGSCDEVGAVARLMDAGIETFVVGFGQGVERETLADMARAGGGHRLFLADDARQLRDALVAIGVQVNPEQCNGVDDDCDGSTDEGLGGAECVTDEAGPCAEGVEACVGGALVCEPLMAGEEEQCDGIDNDCDGSTDEQIPWEGEPCDSGEPGRCAVGASRCAAGVSICALVEGARLVEACDGVDDDCDGEVDEDVGADVACETELSGVCAEGVTVCAGHGLQCTPLALPGVERCDGLDNDCDGPVDEGDPDGGAACALDAQGPCAVGVERCVDGGIECAVTVQPSAEVCDGVDNDCDGDSDEGDPGGGAACALDLLGPCAAGVERCVEGAVACVETVAPAAETCDGVDEDCDGSVDEALADEGALCETGGQGQCGPGRRACADGGWSCVADAEPSAETCDGLDEDCDGAVDEALAEVGAPCETGGQGQCGPGRRVCAEGGWSCLADAEPAPETCDGIDEDCDGSIDEALAEDGARCETGAQGLCGPGRRVCADGGWSCAADAVPTLETCDGRDEDCDGMVDESLPEDGVRCETGGLGQCGPGRRVCGAGAWSCVADAAPTAETCDGTDEDCDGAVDEGLPWIGDACQTGALGVCSDGHRACRDGSSLCEPVALVGVEVCGGRDEDCDGLVDEDIDGIGDACETGLPGLCAPGRLACVGDDRLCVAAAEPAPWDFCDGLDEDCDGLVDEDDAGDGGPCATTEKGLCGRGVRVCTQGAWVCQSSEAARAEGCDGVDEDCDGTVDEGQRDGCGRCMADGMGAPVEVCDGVDDDCDGTVDEAATCPGDAVCLRGACAEPCANNECLGERLCYHEGERSGCLLPCEAVDCPWGERCEDGECVEEACGEDAGCAERGCPVGQMCIDDACLPDPCHGVECAVGQACRDGVCGLSCAGIACAADELCVAGACRLSVCAFDGCPDGQVCTDDGCKPAGGACDDDCGLGQVCVEGACALDPCAAVRCPAGQVCRLRGSEPLCQWADEVGAARAGARSGDAGVEADALDSCVIDEDMYDYGDADIGESDPTHAAAVPVGCTCDFASDGGAPSPLWLLLVLLGAVRRRPGRA